MIEQNDWGESVRSRDANDYLVVSKCILTQVGVSEYTGEQISSADKSGLALDPNRLYRVYRPPEVLEAAIGTLDSLPLKIGHHHENADDFTRETTVGTVGDVTYEEPNLIGALKIWDGEAIRLIESGERRGVSLGYTASLEQRSGEIDGEAYDLVFKDISYNHVALVPTPRIPVAVIADENSKEVENTMTIEEILDKVHSALKNGDINKDSDRDAISKIVKGAADLKEDSADREKDIGDEDEDDDDGKKDVDIDIEDEDDKRGDKVDPSDEIELKDDDGDVDGAKPPPEDIAAMVKNAVDQAIMAERAKAAALEKAKDVSRPIIGDANPKAFSKAEDVYRFALSQKGIDAKSVKDVEALSIMTKMASRQKPMPKRSVGVGDSSGAEAFMNFFQLNSLPKAG